tara:strand:- start:342 stop:515 length:174 start_codon:yes stop_codon:yes gene_type:complete
MKTKTKLLIYEYKERFPTLSAIEISQIFHLNINDIDRLFKKGEIVVPSLMNRKNSVY